MIKRLEKLGDRMLSRFMPRTTAAASCPCGPYPYTGPCNFYPNCGGGLYRECYCANSGATVRCGPCHY